MNLPNAGDRIRLVRMPAYEPGAQLQEEDPMIPGTTGTVLFANDLNVCVDWDVDASGRKRNLSLQVGWDEWEVIDGAA